jgi:1-acyl-sn-glycerol-3-phosphate acyltransferase
MRSRFSPAKLAAFELFFRPWRRRRIHATRLAGLPRDLPRLPLVLVANHVSWWDGFTLREVHRLLRPRAPVWTLMTGRELTRSPFLRSIGGFGIDPDHPASVRGALRFLRARVAERPDATVIVFPQGRIWPAHRRPLGFRRGVEAFARAVSPCVVLPLAIHHEPLTASAPTVFVSAGEPVWVGDGERPDAVLLEGAVEAESDRILDFLSRHGEDAPRHWPDPFGRLDAPASARRVDVPIPIRVP